MGSGMGPMRMVDPVDLGTVMDEVRNPVCTEYPEERRLLQGQPGHPAPARRHHPLDQRRYAAPVDHPGQRDDALAAGRERRGTCPTWATCRACPTARETDDGCQTFYYTNQQSARLMFYHDHAWGITRLNVYAGEAAGYLITDPTEQSLISRGLIPRRHRSR